MEYRCHELKRQIEDQERAIGEIRQRDRRAKYLDLDGRIEEQLKPFRKEDVNVNVTENRPTEAERDAWLYGGEMAISRILGRNEPLGSYRSPSNGFGEEKIILSNQTYSVL